MRVRLLSSILISAFLLSGACSRRNAPFFEGRGCFVSVEKVDTFYCNYVENFRLDSSMVSLRDVKMLYAYCLDGKHIFIREGSSWMVDYVNSCIFSARAKEGMASSFPVKPRFYRLLEEAKGREDLLYLADMLERKSYCNYFSFYYPRRVAFYREVIRFRMALEEMKSGNYNESLKILASLSSSGDFRIRFIASALRDTIMRRLGQEPKMVPVRVDLAEDTLIVNPVCEMDFPETLVVRNGILVRWKTPIIPNF